jgi:hypothetical protein
MTHRFFILLTALFLPAGASTAEVDFKADIQPLLTTYCGKCHGEVKPKAGVNLSLVTDARSALKQRKMLRLALAQVEAGDMPPDDEAKQPTREQRALLVAWLTKAATLDCNDPLMRDPGPAPARRLNRAQYDLTLRELTGIEFSSAEAVGLPDDMPVTGYSTFANFLTLPAAQVEKYFAAADQLLETIFTSKDGLKPRDRKAAEAKAKAQAAFAAIVFIKPAGNVKPRDAARRVIERFAPRAFRRPVTREEIDRLLALFDKSQTKGEPFEAGIRLMLKSVLVSPHFLLRLEETPLVPIASKDLRRPVNDHELAVRLSYFLWSSMPDEPLFELARQGKLSDPATLDQQIKRMLADAKARSLTDHFAVQWLQLGKLETARPSTEFFPTFNRRLRDAMREETVLFFDGLRTGDRPILDLLDADYTYVNQDLAKHYGIEGVQGAAMQRVALKPEHRRGGLLGMGSVLAMTSHVSRTSPTLRGKWVLDVIYGTPPPPPPPDVGEIKEDRKAKEPRSFRELLAQHASRAECAGCHKKMDPLGFALDSFDAVGTWRDTHGGKPLDTTGKLPTGESFSGPGELKKIMLAQKDRFIRNLAEQMLSYALGRELDYFDECVVNEIVRSMEKDGYRFSSLVGGVARSYPFLNRRVAE